MTKSDITFLKQKNSKLKILVICDFVKININIPQKARSLFCHLIQRCYECEIVILVKL